MVKNFREYLYEYWDMVLPDYPMQLDPKKDKGGWVTGDPPNPIVFPNKMDSAKQTIRRASAQIKKDRS